MYPLNRNNVTLYEQISLNDVNTLLIDAVTVPVISEIRADQYINKCQDSENERNPFPYSDITGKYPEIVNSSDHCQYGRSCGSAGRIHTVQCPF